jgi:hypothetical protein
MPRGNSLSVLPQHQHYSIGYLSHRLSAQLGKNRELQKEIKALKRLIKEEYGKGFCAGSADSLGHVFASLPDFASTVWVAACFTASQHRKPPYPLTDEMRAVVEAHIAAHCGRLGIEHRSDFKVEELDFLERAKQGVANGPSA